MKIKMLLLMFLVSKLYANAQKIPEDFGYRHLKFKYQNDPVDVIVISKIGEERNAKPLFFFCQGSLPQPVVKYDEKGLYGTLPFEEALFTDQFHIVIIGKPFVPVISNVNKLGKDFMYFKDFEKEIPPKGYIERNYLDYYVFRNNFILKQLFKERWVRTSSLVLAGHSEGSTIAAKMASVNKKVTQLIYSGGNPYGRIATMLSQEDDKTQLINYWKNVVTNSNNANAELGDSCKATYSFSMPQNSNLLHLTIPILITYGSKDAASAYIGLFEIEAIRAKKNTITFVNYAGLEHNFFGFDKKGATDFENHNWYKIGQDWLEWLNKR